MSFGSRLRGAWKAFWGGPSTPPESPDPDPADEIEETSVYEPAEGSDPPLEIACEGDVFNFRIMPYFRWSSDDYSMDDLADRVNREKGFLAPARGQLMREIWQVVRTFAPHEVLAAEVAVNALPALSRGWCFDNDKIKCTATVRVALDPRLRDHLLPVELQRMSTVSSHAAAMAHVSAVSELSEAWLEAIRSLEKGDDPERQFLAPFVAALADEDFARVMRDLAGRRRTTAVDLVTVLQQASKSHETLGLYEIAKAYDRAVAAFSRQLDLDTYRWPLAEPEVAP